MSSATKDIEAQVGARIAAGVNCAVPFGESDRVLLGHGSGGKLSAALVRGRFLPAFGNPALAQLGDAAVVQVASDAIAISTDTFVVSPLEFPGGNIGTLAVNGTAQFTPAAMREPTWASMSFVALLMAGPPTPRPTRPSRRCGIARSCSTRRTRPRSSPSARRAGARACRASRTRGTAPA